LGNGDGTFQTPRTFAAGFDSRAAAAGDINGDRKPDLVIGNYGFGVLTVLLGQWRWTFAVRQNPASGSLPVAWSGRYGRGR